MDKLIAITIGLGIMSIFSAMLFVLFTMAWSEFENTELWEMIKKHFWGEDNNDR